MTLKLKPDPTFSTAVSIPVPGHKPETLRVVYRHMGREALKQFLSGVEKRTPLDALFEIVAGWEHPDEPFSREALGELLDNNHAAGAALLETYLHELTGGQIGTRRVEA